MKVAPLLVAAGAFAFVGAPGSPVEAPAAAQTLTQCGSVYCAVIETAKKVYAAKCVPGGQYAIGQSCNFDPIKAALKGAWEGATSALCSTNTAACNVLKIAGHLGMPMPYSLGRAGGSGGGGGSDGEWLTDHCRFDIGLDAEGNLVIPSIPLPTGDAMVRASTSPPAGSSEYWSVQGLSSPAIPTLISKGPITGIHYYLHRYNMAQGDKRNWVGAYSVVPNLVKTARPAYYDNTGSLVSRMTLNKDNQGQVAFVNWAYPNDCPSGGSNGGDFHFYYEDFNQACIMYAPNLALSPTGYAMNEKTSIPFFATGNLKTVLAGHPILDCPLATEFLANLTEKLFDKAKPVTGIETPPVDPGDVVTGGEEPLVEDLDDSETDDDTGTPTPPTPGPTPTPTPTPTPSDGPVYDPSVGLGDPNAPDIDWWPDLPTIEVDLGSPACPTYQLNLVGWWDEPFVLDSHCPLIEQNRAAISLLMVAMFSMMSMFIVLRA